MSNLLGYGSAIVNEVISVTKQWTAEVTQLTADATSLMNMIGGLTGGNYGRYFAGARDSSNQTQSTTTIQGLIAAGTAARAAVATTVEAAQSAASNIDVGGSAALAAAIQAVAAALFDALSDPKDAVRIFLKLASFSTGDVTTSDAVGLAQGKMQSGLNDFLRRTAVINLAKASAAYQPSSFDDATQLMQSVVAVIEAEIETAGDEAADATYRALRSLRAAVIDDLTTRGADLAHLAEVSLPASLPALTMAYRLYGDATREADLVGYANPANPAFMPTDFKALAS